MGERFFKNRTNWWGVASGLVFLAGWGASYVFLTARLGSITAGELLSLLGITVVIGLGLNGVGLMLRAAAHGTPGLSMIDGVGKLLGVLAWSIGLTATFVFAVNQTALPVASMGWIFSTVVACALLCIAFAFVVGRPGNLRKPTNP